jgi:Zn-dependent oligopeptidase
MAKDPDTVSKFLSDLAVKLQPIWLKEKEEMLGLKKKEVSRTEIIYYST